MIIARSPLRVSLGGGGTDLPSYYEEHEGFLLSAAIDKYVYVTVMRPFTPGIYLKYSELEQVHSVDEVRHPIIREVLKHQNLQSPQIEIASFADIPAGTGLGSSGSFTTGLLKALYAHRRQHIHARELAELACHIELDRLGEPVGKQDQYISALGGLGCFTFHRDHSVSTTPLAVSMETLHDLEDNLLLFFTGFSRSASSILSEQNSRSNERDAAMIHNLHDIKQLGFLSRDLLENGQTLAFGELMHEHWQRKKERSTHMSNPLIDDWYNEGIRNGAVGGKLVGAGGGGFLMFLAQDRDKLRQRMKQIGLDEVRFRFDFEGASVVLSS